MPQHWVPAVFMRGGISSLSMAAVIGPPTLADADVDYTFAQVAVERPVVDLGANCGNLSSAVGPFAVDQRRCPRADGPALVRVHNTNTGGLIHARFAVSGGCAETRGDMAIPGVAGTGAPIRLDFLDPGGAPPAACSPPATRSTRSSWTAPGRRTSWRPGRR